MKVRIACLTAALALTAPVLAVTAPALAQGTGSQAATSKNIVEAASGSKDHSTLVAAVKAAGLVETLQGQGPFTVFAPTNEAFAKLPSGTVETLLKPESKAALTGVLTYHVVAGRLTAQDLIAMVKQGGGSATLKTVQGETLTVTPSGSTLSIKDKKGGTSTVTAADLIQSNGVIHVVDSVLLPG